MRKIIPILAAVIGVAGAAPAVAQSVGPFPPFEAVTIVRSMGLQVLGPPLRRGPAYVLRAIDPNGQEMRVVIDARYGEILSAVPVLAGPPPRSDQASYQPYPPRGRYEFDDYSETEPEDAAVPLHPPRAIEAPRNPKPHSAAIAPARTPAMPPIPRPRPQGAAVSQAAPRPEIILKPTQDVPVAPLE